MFLPDKIKKRDKSVPNSSSTRNTHEKKQNKHETQRINMKHIIILILTLNTFKKSKDICLNKSRKISVLHIYIHCVSECV